MKVFYKVGDIQVEVGKIEDDADETAIMQQIYAIGMKWTDNPRAEERRK